MYAGCTYTYMRRSIHCMYVGYTYTYSDCKLLGRIVRELTLSINTCDKIYALYVYQVYIRLYEQM